MKEKNVTLVHNPTSNLKLGSGIARIKRALEIGVNVALGTDGCASNDDLDMFEEMRLAALLASGVSHDPTALSAWDVFEMATMNGARALGRCDTGVLEVGKKADFAVLDLNSIHFKPALDAVNMLVYSAHSTDVLKTVVDGKVVYDRSSFSVPESLESDFAIAVSQIGLKGVR
jgi:5-methylthioadenosine/S-adenosylhomocysteine deaminase